MTDKEYLMTLRSGGLIRGIMPFLATINNASTYDKFKAKRYIISYRDNKLFIDSTSLFSKLPNHKQDITIDIDNINKFKLVSITRSIDCLFIYINNKSIGFCVGKGYQKSAFSENNLEYFINYLKSRGIKSA